MYRNVKMIEFNVVAKSKLKEWTIEVFFVILNCFCYILVVESLIGMDPLKSPPKSLNPLMDKFSYVFFVVFFFFIFGNGLQSK